ncbi:MAG: MBL fold metallo-hydrolase [Prevotellaceae bacterium]|jgi:glyoxylase-like metal-dependent hydrolase (beta-lactamase superfamily II)|nr:MBL fold metallo-hydrolase [Prevotellaceae bacterium]
MKKMTTLLLAVMPFVGSAQEAASSAIYTHQVGAYEIVVLPENQGQGNPSILIDATPEMLAQAIPDGTYPNAVNAFLVKTPAGNVLFDTGFGRNLTRNLAAAGVKPEDIGTLVITHAHGDHIGGMLTADGQRAFPRARLILSDTEKTYWVDTQKQEAATRAFNAYKENVQLVTPGKIEEPAGGDGIFYLAAPGHTPGHIVCLLRSKGEQLLIWGDLAHAMAIQMPFPQVSVRYDTDPVLAAKSRQEILKFVAEHHIPIAGMHVAFPGMGKIENNGKGGYRFIPFSARR